MFHGKAIYQPAGKAGEYSQWAANFYNGCSAKCEYCYNRHGRSAKILGGDKPTLKKSLVDESTALEIFKKELNQNLPELRKHGLFFNFVSDPCLKETIELNYLAILECDIRNVPVKILTKQTWWLKECEEELFNLPKNIVIGFTLTGHDELEPGAATNAERIEAMKKLHDAGFKTWASIEPIIDFQSSLKMIDESKEYCDFYKIGLKSGGKYIKSELEIFIMNVHGCLYQPIYWKDYLLKAAGIDRESLPSNCVTRDFNL
jgi:DNA repair photolyase